VRVFGGGLLMDIIAAVQEAVVGGFKSIFGIALIVFPLMVVLEIIKDMILILAENQGIKTILR